MHTNFDRFFGAKEANVHGRMAPSYERPVLHGKVAMTHRASDHARIISARNSANRSFKPTERKTVPDPNGGEDHGPLPMGGKFHSRPNNLWFLPPGPSVSTR